jgi:hypothetical protein
MTMPSIAAAIMLNLKPASEAPHAVAPYLVLVKAENTWRSAEVATYHWEIAVWSPVVRGQPSSWSTSWRFSMLPDGERRTLIGWCPLPSGAASYEHLSRPAASAQVTEQAELERLRALER